MNLYVEGSYTPNVGGTVRYEASNSYLYERVAYDGRVRVEIDEGKDGSIDAFEVYDSKTFEIVPNSAPITIITFPKEIFTDINLSDMKVVTYDPDLDDFIASYEWQVNAEVKSSSLIFSNELFKKHDTLKLKVMAEDTRAGDIKKSVAEKTQVVLNSRPKITSDFSKLSLTLGESKTLEYTITDADNDEIEITWEHTYGYDDETIEEYLSFSSFDCTYAIQEYDTEHNVSYSNLTTREQEDVRNALCQENFDYQLTYDFLNDTTFSAISTGFFKHKMIVSDGDYNRTRRLASYISQMDLIESQDYNHVAYTYNDTHSVYMEDMNNDGNKDLIHITGLDPFSDKEPLFVIEYMNGKALVEKVEYNLSNLTRYDLDYYYIKDLNGDEKLDVLFVYSGDDTSDNTSYGKMLQKADGTFENVEKFTLDNRHSLLVDDIIGDKAEEIIIVKADNYSNLNEVKIYSKEANNTIDINLPTSIGSRLLDTQLLVYDLDENSKKDIIVIAKSFLDEGKLNFICSVSSQETNGSFSEQIYTTTLQNNLKVTDYESIQNVKIVDIDDNKDIWIVLSSKNIYFIKLEENKLVVLNSIEYDSSSRTAEIHIFDPVDINKDGKDDILIALGKSNTKPLNILIQTDNLQFLTVQKYNFTNLKNSFNGNSSSVLGDIDNDGKQELFVSTGESELSVLYFK